MKRAGRHMRNALAGATAAILSAGMIVAQQASNPPRRSLPISLWERLDQDIERDDLPFELAKDAAEAALKACTNGKDGSISVALTNGYGDLRIFFAHEDVRSHDAYEHARRKAFTVLQTAKSSRLYPAASFDEGNMQLPQSYFDAPPLTPPDYAGRPGALPIMRGRDLVGVISVDGRWNYATGDGEDFEADEHCAQAGLDAIKDRVQALKSRKR